jgi:hypothetical protein
MKTTILAGAAMLALALLGSARAESFASKLGEGVATASGSSPTATGANTQAADDAEQQVLQAEAADAADRALAGARPQAGDGGER